MLTGDLVRYKVDGERIRPRYITKQRASKYLEDIEKLTQIVQDHTGLPQKTLFRSLLDFEGERIDYKIIRGLCKLILEQAEFAPAEQMDYPGFRKTVFSKAQKHYPILTRKDLIHSTTRDEVLKDLALEMRIPPEKILDRLYGDLPENQSLIRFEPPRDASTLLKKYNLALAQGLLYRAAWLKIRLKSHYRIVFQYIKLARLMHWIRPLQPEQGYEIIINGPASLLAQTQRYGVRMAVFLPGLILAENWSMHAEIHTADGRKHFYLDHRCGLTSHYSDRPPFDSAIEQNFYEKWARKPREWSIEREGGLIDLGDSVFIPDFTFRHPDGRTAHLEIVGYWTPEYLRQKIAKLKKVKKDNLILAVNSQLNCSRDDFKAEVIYYRTGIKLKEVTHALEAIN